MARLTLETIVARQGEPLTAPVEGELVMLDPRQSRYFGLDAVGHRIWQLIEQPTSVAAVCDRLRTEFDVDDEACAAEVLGFLEQLREQDLIEIR